MTLSKWISGSKATRSAADEKMATTALKEFAECHLRDLRAKFPLSYSPHLEWKRFRVTAGMAYYQEGTIGLSASVLQTQEQIRETLGHEYAHLLAYDRVGKKGTGHGAAWHQAMKDIGLEPRIRHNFSVERNSLRQQVDYVCLRCGVTISRKRRLPRHRKYVHTQCGGDLALLRVLKVT